MTKQSTQQKTLALATSQGIITSQDVVRKLGVSRQYASRILGDLAKSGDLIKIGSTRGAIYVTADYLGEHGDSLRARYKKTLDNRDIEEHLILDDIERKYLPLSKLAENVRSIFTFAFSEMLNNAIDHSDSPRIHVEVVIDIAELIFIVDDLGIGAFENIRTKHKLANHLEAIQDLLKGKVTTMPKMHSGEGIFFTSRVADHFELHANGYVLRFDNTIDDVFIDTSAAKRKGTKVIFRIDTKSEKHLTDVFRQYTNVGADSDHGFDKTEIEVKLYQQAGVHISRSQARRILSGLDKFSVIVMDYDQVPVVGQAFADEIYRVFLLRHPKITIENKNMSEGVEFMVNRAITEAKRGRK